METNKPYVVIYNLNSTTSFKEGKYELNRTITSSTTKAEYFDDLKEAAEFRASIKGVLLKNLVYEVTEKADDDE